MSCCERIKFAMSKLFLECFGTAVLTLLFLTQINYIIVVGLWVLTIFLYKISGAQMNPAVTLAYMFRADSKKIHVSLGLMMMGAQCLGAWLGALWYWVIAFKIDPLEPIAGLGGS